MACELELMLAKLYPEEQESIRTKADNLEVLFKGNVVCMKDKGEGWDGMFNDEYTDNETTEEQVMKKVNAAVFGLFTMALVVVGCVPAQAVDLSLGYQDNQVIDKDGAVLSAGGEYNNLRYGVTTFATTDKLESYGVYGKMPIYIQGTNFAVTPQIQVDRYQDIGETVGGVGLGAEYAFTNTLRLEAIGMVSKGFDNSDVRGETYTIGLTKTF